MMEIGLFAHVPGDTGRLRAARSARSQALQWSPEAKAGAAVRASRTAVPGSSSVSGASGDRAVSAARTASDSAQTRSGVTEGCPVHQA